jgi:CMP-N-acetylneuraminic acid synthetase
VKVLGVTLARGGSKGVPGKHTRDLGGKPVIAWTVDEAHKCRLLDEYVVSSDSAVILGMVKHGQQILRPSILAKDDTPTLPALVHAVGIIEEMRGRFDYIVELRATAPFKTSEDIEDCIWLLDKTGADSVIGVSRLDDHHPARIKWINEHGYLQDWPGCDEPASGRRQDCQPAAYIRNGSIYALRREVVMERGGAIFGHQRSLPYIMPPERSVNIDTELDFKLCQLLAVERYAA